MAQALDCARRANPPQGFDRFDAQEFGAIRENCAIHKAQKLIRSPGIAAHSNLVHGKWLHERIEKLQKVNEYAAALRRAGDRKLANDRVMKSTIAFAQPGRKNFGE